jgi:hypothetical protein
MLRCAICSAGNRGAADQDVTSLARTTRAGWVEGRRLAASCEPGAEYGQSRRRSPVPDREESPMAQPRTQTARSSVPATTMTISRRPGSRPARRSLRSPPRTGCRARPDKRTGLTAQHLSGSRSTSEGGLMKERTAGRSHRMAMPVNLTVGRRSVNWQLGRLIIDDHELVIRSPAAWWIPPRSAPRTSIGEISVVRRIEVTLPILSWRRMDVVRFDPASPFADVQLRVPPRRRITAELRGRGYTVAED